MKKLLLATTALFLLAVSTTSFALQARGWRLAITDSIENETPIVIAEIEWLHNATYDIDAVSTGSGGSFSFADLGIGDVTDQFEAGSIFVVSGSTGNDGTYKVASSSYSSLTNVTTVTIATDDEDYEDTVSDSTDDGTITTSSSVDGSRSDLGASACGWTRKLSNNPGGTTQTGVSTPCDSVGVNYRPDSSLTIPSGTRRTRLGKLMFDDIQSSYFMTRGKVSESKPFYVQYTWHILVKQILTVPHTSELIRDLPDVEAYSITVPNAYLGPSEDGYAPSNWSVQYMDPNTGRWVNYEGADVSAANFNDGTDVTVDSAVVGKKLTFLLP